ncbi:11880_t:CDS:2, partial [Acaulospora colombiana]
RQNERDLERSFDRNECELLQKSGDFNTLKLSSSYAEKSTELLEIDVDEEDEDGVIIIDDVDELCFEEGDPTNDLKIGDTNVSQLFRQYQNESLKIAKT